ncbi:hypothetical protein GOP47_0019444 [Adiantum capillus-veneris]|uniref:Uncharacterized protein n=1 Tax=Adiantum capillus-veneris TaxID=13818 RepID=A0A9D4Z7U4_ADICA|nr:hypothetical protein GOP47_0019444 [Adiantum capillus-veneris]
MEKPVNRTHSHCISFHTHQVSCVDDALLSCNYDDDDHSFLFEDTSSTEFTCDEMHAEEHAVSPQPLFCNEYVGDPPHGYVSHGVVINGNNIAQNILVSEFSAQCGGDKSKAACSHCMEYVACNHNESALCDLIGQCPYEPSCQGHCKESSLHDPPFQYATCMKVIEDCGVLEPVKCNNNDIHNTNVHVVCAEDCVYCGVGDEKQAHNHALDFISEKDNAMNGENVGPNGEACGMDVVVASTHEDRIGELTNDCEACILPNTNPDISPQQYQSEIFDSKDVSKKELLSSSTKKKDMPAQLADSATKSGYKVSIPSKKHEHHYQHNTDQASLKKTSSFANARGKSTDSIRIWKAYANASFSTGVKLPLSHPSLAKSLPCLASRKPSLLRSVSATSELLKTSPKKPTKPLPAASLKKNAMHSTKADALPSGESPPTPNCRPPLKPASLNVVSTPTSAPISQALTSAAFARFMALPLVNAKAREEVRLDLRGQKVKSLDCNLVNLTAKLEFVYLRDNKLSHLAGIEILRRVKVLDLSFNEFKGLGLHPLASCKALQQLYLAGNQLISLVSLPQLPNLEFLSVAQNKLKDLTMVPQPKLQVLAASKNKISTFKGFPQFPSLEHLRLEENPISDTQHVQAVAIILAGPYLKRFNNSDLTMEEQELACMYPPHTGLCIRDGWEFCSVEEAFVSSMKFLEEQWADRIPPGYTFEQAFIEQPFEEYPCKCQFIFRSKSDEFENLELKVQYQWFIGGKTPSDFVAIEGANKEIYWPNHRDIGHCLKVECALAFEDVKYAPTFAVSFPVLPGSGCPKVTRLIINGDFREGNVIAGEVEVAWCGGSATKGIVSWLRHDESSSPRMVPGAEDLEYLLSLDDVGAKLILMYTPLTKEGIKGDPCFATTEVIQAGLPSVGDLRVIGDMVEGNTIRGVGQYFGGKEGLSKFEWFQEVEDSGGFQLRLEGLAELTLTEKDVGLRMLFQYSPVNSEGFKGLPVSVVTEKVSRAPPKVTSLRIIGELCEGSTVSVSATISGGSPEGASRVRWFKRTMSGLSLCAKDKDMEEIGTSTIPEVFHIPLGYFGFYLVAEYTPILADGVAGEEVLTVSSVPVNMLLPSLTSLSIVGEHREGETLSAAYSYIGGKEGNSQFSWFLHENEHAPGTPIPEAAGLLKFTISKSAINKLVSLKCIPVREDGYVGVESNVMAQEIVQPGVPKLLSLNIVGDPVEGSHLRIVKSYCGGLEGTSKLQWFQMNFAGCLTPIKGATSHTYTSTPADVDSYLCVSYEPCRSDGVLGSALISLPFGPMSPALPTCEALELCGETIEGECLRVSAVYRGGTKGSCTCQWIRQRTDGPDKKLGVQETIKLTVEDVGCCIKLVFTPIRKDGVRGTPRTAVSGVIKAGEPTAIHLMVPNGCEHVEMTPERCYFGGVEGDSEFTWFRVEDRLEGFRDFSKAQVVGKSERYIPQLADVGSYLALLWIPVRKDGKRGKPCLACSSQKVVPAVPIMKNVTIKRLSHNTFIGDGNYYGGFEGESQKRWYRQAPDGVMMPIVGAVSNMYTLTDEDYTYSLVFGYTPIRQDGVVGELVLSAPTENILPELPRVQELFIKAEAIEGEVLVVTEEIPNEERQKHVWEKYIKHVNYQWARSSIPNNTESFEALPFQRSCLYSIRTEDIGYYLQCECTVIDVFGRSSPPVSILSSAVSPGAPKVDKVEIEGGGYHSDTYAIRGIYSGGKEGKSVIQWFRAMARSPELFPIGGEAGRMYEADVEDAGCRLVAVYTPVREDGVEGTPVSATTDPITVEPIIAEEVAKKLGQGNFKFEALLNRDPSPTKLSQGSGHFEKRLIDINKRRIKAIKPGSKAFLGMELRYTPPFYVEVDKSNQHRLRLRTEDDYKIELMLQTRQIRDLIVLLIKGFNLQAH